MNKEYLKNMDKVKELNIFFEKEYKKQIDFKNNNDNIKSLLDIDIFLNQLKDKINNLFQINLDYSLNQIIKDDVIITNIIFNDSSILTLYYKSIDFLKNIFQIIFNLNNETIKEFYKEYYEKEYNICLINSLYEYHQANLFENDNTFTITLYNSLA